MSELAAIVLAGAPAGPEMNQAGGLPSRAMVRVGDRTMLQWVVDALSAAPSVSRIIAVGNVTADGLDQVIEPGEDLVTNIRRGIEAAGGDEPVLVVSSDIPMLTPESVEDFIARATPLDVDLAYPIIPKAHCEARYPDLKRTYLKTADGVFTGGNLMLVKPDFIARNWEAIANAYAARKHVPQLARMIGLGVLARVILGQVLPGVLRVSALERAVSRMLSAKVAAVVSAYPEIGEDVDKPSDLAVVQRLMSRQADEQGKSQ